MKTSRDIIVRPIITEKTTKQYEAYNKVTFEVIKNANKIEIKKAIEEIYNVKVTAVNVINTHSKKTRFGRFVGKTKAIKKAIVTVAAGQSIQLY